MNSPVNFLFESGVSLTLLSLVYLLFLRKETFFRMNRIFLLGSIAFSVILPFLKFRIYEPKQLMLPEITVTPYRNLIEAVTIYGNDFSGSVENAVLSANLIILIYFSGVVFFLIRFLLKISQILRLIRSNQVIQVNGIKMVSLEQESSPFSFLGYVFVSSPSAKQSGYNEIVAHELEHVKQGHSFDVLLLEILTIFQWFNPAMWMLKHAVRENHEFLADQAVLNSGISHKHYLNLLINQVVGVQYEMANNFNYSLIRKRIKMMSKIKSSKISAVKIIFGILIASGLIVAFACEQKKSAEANLSGKSGDVKIIFSGDSLRIVGSTKELKKINTMLASGNFQVSSDSLQSGFLIISGKEALAKTLDAGEKIFFEVDEMPEFSGGEDAFRRFIAENVTYPDEAKKNGIQGKVFVQFVVAADGTVRNAKVIKAVSPSLDREALRVINLLPVWKPGKQKGQPVNVSYTVPINFVLQ